MGELNDIFGKLNIADQMKLNAYINQKINVGIMKANTELEKLAREKEQRVEDANNSTWERIETFLHISMREHKISEDRIKKIDARVLELSNITEEKMLIGEERKSEYKILEDADFQKMIELLMDSNCKNCKEHNSKCEVYLLLKKYKAPYSGEKGKCKYAYFRIGKKVV